MAKPTELHTASTFDYVTILNDTFILNLNRRVELTVWAQTNDANKLILIEIVQSSVALFSFVLNYTVNMLNLTMKKYT